VTVACLWGDILETGYKISLSTCPVLRGNYVSQERKSLAHPEVA
jgi:hypothetical protein